MNIAFYFANYIPEAGGAFSFENSIFSELQKHSGRYEIYIFINVKEYSGSDRINSHVVNMRPEIERLQKNKFLKRVYGKIRRILGLTTGRTSPLEEVLNRCIRKYNIDLLWLPGPYSLRLSVPYVYTIWDLAHRVHTYFPEVSVLNGEFEKRDRLYNRMIPPSSFIITGNSVGKKEISTFYSYPEERIVEIPFFVPLMHKGESNDPLIGGPYAFYPAQFWPHKNHIGILYALAKVRKERKIPLRFVFSGGDKGNLLYVKKIIKELELEDAVTLAGFISQEDLVRYYTHAFCLIYPSLFGPNNLPPLEAMSLGCPVLVSSIEGHREQLGEAALFFDPFDEDDIAAKICELYDNPSLRQELIGKGIELTKKLTPTRYVESIFEVVDRFEKIRRCWA